MIDDLCNRELCDLIHPMIPYFPNLIFYLIRVLTKISTDVYFRSVHSPQNSYHIFLRMEASNIFDFVSALNLYIYFDCFVKLHLIRAIQFYNGV